MARVNVETRAIAEGRFHHLAEDLGKTRSETIGMLVIFWFDSQERGVWSGSRARIEKFIPCPKELRPSYFDALLEYEYISPMKDGSGDFVIHGNKKHIEALNSKSEAGQKGGKKSGEIRSKKPKVIKGNEAHASNNEAPASSSEPNAVQCSTIQCNTGEEAGAPPSQEIKKNPTLETCIQTWIGTLRHFEYERGLSPGEDLTILQATKTYGAETVDLALFGARYEPASPGYSPRDYLSVARIFGNDKKNKPNRPMFLNWAETGKKLETKKKKSTGGTLDDLNQEDAEREAREEEHRKRQQGADRG